MYSWVLVSELRRPRRPFQERVFIPLRLMAETSLVLYEEEPGLGRIEKARFHVREETTVSREIRQALLDKYDGESILEVRQDMDTYSGLSGSQVMNDENAARNVYPHVCWEHPQMYPGIMVPNWAIAWREACMHAGLSLFGRETLKYVRRLFPDPQRDDIRNEKLQEAYAEGEDVDALEAKFAEEEKAELAQEKAGYEALRAALAVLQLSTTTTDSGVRTSALTQSARDALAMKVLDVLEAGGLTYAAPNDRGPFRRDLTREERISVNALCARDVARSELLTTASKTTSGDIIQGRMR